MNYKYYLGSVILNAILFGYTAAAQAPGNINSGPTVTGFVFEDINHNGIKDNNEPGIKGVVVSDQVAVTATLEDGDYRLTRTKGNRIIFISLPDSYQITGSFWQPVDETKEEEVCNFPLIKSKTVSSFTFIHASDTHISPASIDRMKKLEMVTDSLKPDLMLITGDLIKDALRVPEHEATSLYDLFKIEKTKLNTTTWCVPGNHEIFGIERHLSLVSTNNPLYGIKMYHLYLGPDYYSFNYGGVHFIGLNSVSFEDLWYYGNIDPVQLDWLKKDIAFVAPQTPVITFQHIPFYSGGLSLLPFEDSGPSRTIEQEKGVMQYRHIVSNAQAVMAVLSTHNYPLALAGHYHYQQKFSLAGVQTRFEQTAAVVEAASNGIFKMPSGIMIYSVKNGRIDEGKFILFDK
ncbi:MAG: metallophosphoesterase [Ginsengibacter sp.]